MVVSCIIPFLLQSSSTLSLTSSVPLSVHNFFSFHPDCLSNITITSFRVAGASSVLFNRQTISYHELTSTVTRAYCMPDHVSTFIGPVRSAMTRSIHLYCVWLIFGSSNQWDLPITHPSHTRLWSLDKTVSLCTIPFHESS